MNGRLYMPLAVDRVGFVQFHYLQSPILVHLQLSRHMGKQTICLGENKGADQLRSAVTAKLISAFVFATRIVQFLYFINPNFPASSHLLCLYSLVCVGPVRKPHCWFSHEVAQRSRLSEAVTTSLRNSLNPMYRRHLRYLKLGCIENPTYMSK